MCCTPCRVQLAPEGVNGLFRLVCASVLTPCSAVMSLYRQVDVVELCNEFIQFHCSIAQYRCKAGISSAGDHTHGL